jgi:fatty-acyl-CoA synthase
MPTRSLSDIEAIEAQPISSRALPESTFEALLASAKRNPHAKALTFFQAASSYNRAHTWTYAEFIADVTRAANAFHTFGVTSDHPVLRFAELAGDPLHYLGWRDGGCCARDKPHA